MMRSSFILGVALGLAACSQKSASGECTGNSGCDAGKVCIDSACVALCQTDNDCGANDCSGNGKVCADQVCVAGCRDTVPEIVGIDGTGTADSSTDPRGTKAGHRLRDQLVVTGAHLQGAAASLTPATGAAIDLVIVASTDAQLTATLPADLAAGQYTLTVANQIGSAQAGAWVLQGEQGIQGEPQTGSGVLSLLQSLGSPVPGLNAATAATATQALTLVDGSSTPHTYAEIAMPAGAVSHFAMSTCPTGWIPANGLTVSRATYAGLFAAIGTTYGAGDGSTTFVLPDLRGEFLRAWDAGRGVDSGRSAGTAQAQDFKSFTFSNLGPYQPGGGYQHGPVSIAKSGASPSPPIFGGWWSSGAPGCGGIQFNFDDSEVRPRNIALLVCLKL